MVLQHITIFVHTAKYSALLRYGGHNTYYNLHTYKQMFNKYIYYIIYNIRFICVNPVYIISMFALTYAKTKKSETSCQLNW